MTISRSTTYYNNNKNKRFTERKVKKEKVVKANKQQFNT
jgi:hypothetical protein